MSLATSGPISIGGTDPARSINAQFGRASNAQTSMSQLYRNGGIVGSGAPNVPTSGAISLSQFYGAANRIAQTITISANQTNYVANTAKVTGYQAGLMDVTFVINGGVAISANSTGVFAFDIDTSWAAGDTVTVVNNGTIVGVGGNGGRGAGNNSGASVAGSAGGPAFRAQRATSVNNAGTIAGGGGGGGGGGCVYGNPNPESGATLAACGGGGGGGRSSAVVNTTGGAGGTPAIGGTQNDNGTPGQLGGTGTFSSQGAGGAGGTFSPYTGGTGGSGGGWGAAGGTGGPGTSPLGPSGGGAGGAAVSGNGNITWVATGTRLGAIT